MQSLKVVIIGGGSSYTPEIIEGFIKRYHEFPVTEIVLVDVEAGLKKATIIQKLAKRMIEKSGLPIGIDLTLDRKKALEKANFVSSQIRVGGLAARAKDERIPLSHGLLGQETNGAGGVFKALRTIPVVLDIAEDIATICPNAWLINFTNPAGIVTEAIINHSAHQRVVGVCNIPYNMRMGISKAFDCDIDDVEIEFIGLNHFAFGRQVLIQGVDRTEEILELLLQEKSEYRPANIVADGWTQEFLKAFKLFPNPYHNYYFKPDEMLKKSLESYQTNGTRAEVVQQVERELFEKYQNEDLDEKPKELEKRGGAYYSEAACSIMTSIYNNKGDIQTINTKNRGTISDLPYDSVIETNAIIGAFGPRPIVIGEMPKSIKGHVQLLKNFEELIIEAAVTGQKELIYQAFIMNPLIRDEAKASLVIEELMEAHKDYLPQFSNEEPTYSNKGS